MIENIKARFKAKRFNIWTEKIELTNREGYFIYNGQVYFGNRFGVFFKSCQILFASNNTTTKNTEVKMGKIKIKIKAYGLEHALTINDEVQASELVDKISDLIRALGYQEESIADAFEEQIKKLRE
jgi:hypothetical protein